MGKESIGGTGDRFRHIADELFEGNKSELARSLDMKPSSFAKYTDGSRRPGSKILERLSRMGVNINWFLSGEGRMMDTAFAENASDVSTAVIVDARADEEDAPAMTTDHAEKRFFCIPIVRIQENENGDRRMIDREGVECLTESFIEQRYGVDPGRLREFRVTGNAMEGTIRPGDRLLVDIDGCDSLVDGEICLIDSPSGVLLRRIHLQGTTLVLAADNESVPNLDLGQQQWDEKYQPLARVLEVIRSV